MKKLFIPVVAAFCMFAASCGNKTQPNLNPADTLTAVPAVNDASDIEALTQALDGQLAASDTEGLQSTIEAIRQTYEDLVKKGDMQSASAYAKTVKEYLESHAADIKKLTAKDTTIGEIISTVTNIPTDAETTAEAAQEYLNNLPTVDELASKAASKATEKAEEAVENAKSEVKAKATEKVNEATDKAKEATDKAIDDAQKKASDAVSKGVGKLLGK